MKPPRIIGPGKMAAESFAAAVLAIAVGAVAEWVFYVKLPATVRFSLALVPFVLSILTFSAVSWFRWRGHRAPIGGIVLFAAIGLAATIAGSAVLLIMVGCHFNECINL
jgi:hypothetical protein